MALSQAWRRQQDHTVHTDGGLVYLRHGEGSNSTLITLVGEWAIRGMEKITRADWSSH